MARWQPVEPRDERRGYNSLVVRVVDTTGQYQGHAAQKMFLPERFERYARFGREGRVAVSLNHPNIVRIIDIYLPEESDRRQPPYLVMPWLSGGTLAALMQQTPFVQDAYAALRLIQPILGAVHYLHEQGKYHRDIKPSNIVLSEETQAVLVDFGLCFDLDDVERLTLTGEAIGSLGYRAPEYFGGRYDVRDHGPGDIFALGKLIWAVLVGERPDEGPVLQYPKWNLVHRLRNPGVAPLQQLLQWMTKAEPANRPRIETVITEAAGILQPGGVVPSDERGRRFLRQFSLFLETDPQLGAKLQKEEEEATTNLAIREILEEVRQAIEQDPNLLTVRSERERLYYAEFTINGPEGYFPNAGIAETLGKRGVSASDLVRGKSVYARFRPLRYFEDRLPAVVAQWTLVPKEEGRVRVASYVWLFREGMPGLWPTPDPVRSFVDFTTALESPGLRRELKGLVARQVTAFLDVLCEFVEQALEDSK